jgi:transglutaminase-like putative cysteine protease
MNPASANLPLGKLLLLFGGLALAALPHTQRLPWWVNGWMALFFLLRIWIAMGSRKLPHRAWLIALAFGGAVGVFLSFRTIFGRDAGVTLLVLLMSLKLLELKTMRDIFVAVYLAYFLALTNFFYLQTIPTAAMMMVTVLIISASLVSFNDTEQRLRDAARTAGILLLQASPVMLLLFFLFPRVPGPLWGLPQDAFSGVTGLSDSMTPGSLSSLSQSDAIAFRAKFAGTPPPRRVLYWRGPVFWEFDGKTWRGGNTRLNNDYQVEALGQPYDYEMTLEPHNRNWLFALDMPSRMPPQARMTTDYQMLSLPPVRTRMRYELRSHVNYKALSGADARDLAIALRLPRVGNPRARELAATWRAEAGTGPDSNAAVVRRGIEYFRNSRIEYTLTPPLLGENTVDEFVFDTKRGFCEHFSSAFAFMMRAANVPARVVTGYQGGELNPVDGYMEVRQAEAHAWTEVWSGGEGWVRIDPTALAVPIRVDSGLAAAVPQSSVFPALMGADAEWLRAIRFNWNALANKWNQWVLGYNFERQREMLSLFGVQSPDWRTLAMMLFWSTAGVIGLTALWLFGRWRRNDPVQRAWSAFCAKLARTGMKRGNSEGPLTYGERAARGLPQRADLITKIVALYIDLRYGRDIAPSRTRELRELVSRFRP